MQLDKHIWTKHVLSGKYQQVSVPGLSSYFLHFAKIFILLQNIVLFELSAGSVVDELSLAFRGRQNTVE